MPAKHQDLPGADLVDHHVARATELRLFGSDKRGSVASALFPHTVLSYQNAAGALHPAAQGISGPLGVTAGSRCYTDLDEVLAGAAVVVPLREHVLASPT
jgi:hypothetical protein